MSDPQLCTLRELQDGTYTIHDLADMHEALDEMAEYRHRYEAAEAAKRRST